MNAPSNARSIGGRRQDVVGIGTSEIAREVLRGPALASPPLPVSRPKTNAQVRMGVDHLRLSAPNASATSVAEARSAGPETETRMRPVLSLSRPLAAVASTVAIVRIHGPTLDLVSPLHSTCVAAPSEGTLLRSAIERGGCRLHRLYRRSMASGITSISDYEPTY